MAGWARAASGAGNRWAAIAAAVRWPEPRWLEPVVGTNVSFTPYKVDIALARMSVQAALQALGRAVW